MTSSTSDIEREAERRVMQGGSATPGMTGTTGLAASGTSAPVAATTTTTTTGSALPTAAPTAGVSSAPGTNDHLPFQLDDLPEHPIEDFDTLAVVFTDKARGLSDSP